jgi:hypothetical protein
MRWVASFYRRGDAGELKVPTVVYALAAMLLPLVALDQGDQGDSEAQWMLLLLAIGCAVAFGNRLRRGE